MERYQKQKIIMPTWRTQRSEGRVTLSAQAESETAMPLQENGLDRKGWRRRPDGRQSDSPVHKKVSARNGHHGGFLVKRSGNYDVPDQVTESATM